MNNKQMSLSQSFISLQVDKLLYVLSIMFLLPFLFHLIPSTTSVPLGQIWIPIFYAPLVAIFFCKNHVSLVAAVLSPTINSLLLGMPAPFMAKVLSLELLVFVLIGLFLKKKYHLRWWIGPVAILFAKCFSWALCNVVLRDIVAPAALMPLADSLRIALPGLGVICCMNMLMAYQQRT